MFADNRKISHRQLFRQLILGFLGIYLVSVPVTEDIRGRQGIFCLAIVGVLFCVGSVYFTRIRNCYFTPEKYFGKLGARVFCILYLSYLFVTGVFLLLVISRITGRFFIEGSSPAVVITVSAAACYLGSHQGLERRGRMAEVCFPIILFVLAVMLVLALTRVRVDYLAVQGGVSGEGLLRGSYRMFSLFLPVFILPFTLGNVEKAGSSGRAQRSAVFLITGILGVVLILLQGALGIGGYEEKSYPVFDMMAGVDLPGDFLERIDIFWIAAVMFCIFFALGSVFFYNHEILYRSHMEKGAPYLAGAILVCGIACEKAGMNPEWYRRVLEYIYGPLFLLLAAVSWIVYRRGKYHEKNSSKEA